MKKFAWISLVIVACFASQSCRSSQLAFTEDTTKYNGMVPVDGPSGIMQKTTVIGVHLLFGLIPVYRASLDSALDSFTKDARKRGASRVRVISATRETGIWYLPPFTFFITPVFFDMTGEIYR
jgi:hypothetical protein